MTCALDMAHKGQNLVRSGAAGGDISPLAQVVEGPHKPDGCLPYSTGEQVDGREESGTAKARSQLALAYSRLISAARIPMPLSTMSSSWANEIRKHSSR